GDFLHHCQSRFCESGCECFASLHKQSTIQWWTTLCETGLLPFLTFCRFLRSSVYLPQYAGITTNDDDQWNQVQRCDAKCAVEYFLPFCERIVRNTLHKVGKYGM